MKKVKKDYKTGYTIAYLAFALGILTIIGVIGFILMWTVGKPPFSIASSSHYAFSVAVPQSFPAERTVIVFLIGLALSLAGKTAQAIYDTANFQRETLQIMLERETLMGNYHTR
jgi:uncharacterized membrane protein